MMFEFKSIIMMWIFSELLSLVNGERSEEDLIYFYAANLLIPVNLSGIVTFPYKGSPELNIPKKILLFTSKNGLLVGLPNDLI